MRVRMAVAKAVRTKDVLVVVGEAALVHAFIASEGPQSTASKGNVVTLRGGDEHAPGVTLRTLKTERQGPVSDGLGLEIVDQGEQAVTH